MGPIRPGFLLSLAVHGGVAMAALSWWQSEQATVAHVHPRLLVTFDISENEPALAEPQAVAAAGGRPDLASPGPVTPTPPGTQPPSALAQAPPAPLDTQAAAVLLAAPRDVAGMREAYAAQVWQHIARFRPRGVRLQGTATVAIEIADDGDLVSASLAQASGSGRLDRLAIDAATRAVPYPPPPAGLGPADRRFLVPFAFQ